MRPWPRWLRLADAVQYSGLSKGRLKEMALAREIVGGQDPGDRRGRDSEGTWIFDRLSIDRWRLNQLGEVATLFEQAEDLAASVLT